MNEDTLYTCTDCGAIKNRQHFTSAKNPRGCSYICNICRGIRRREQLLISNSNIDKLEVIKTALKLSKSIQEVLDLTNLSIKNNLFNGNAELFLTVVSKKYPKSYSNFIKKLLNTTEDDVDCDDDDDIEELPPTPPNTPIPQPPSKIKEPLQPIKVFDIAASEPKKCLITFNKYQYSNKMDCNTVTYISAILGGLLTVSELLPHRIFNSM
jgi:hypothetical protein